MPFLYALHDRFPSAAIDIACTPRNISLFRQVSFLREVVTFKGETSALHRMLALREYTLLYNPKDHPSFTFTQITRHVQANVKVCIDHPAHNARRLEIKWLLAIMMMFVRFLECTETIPQKRYQKPWCKIALNNFFS